MRKSPVINSSALWWELPIVLLAHSKEPLKPFICISLNILLLKTALPLPLTSAQSVSDLCALFGLLQLFADEGGCDWCCAQKLSFASDNIKVCLGQGHSRQMCSVPLMQEKRETCRIVFCPLQILVHGYVKDMATVRHTVVVYMLKR